MSERLRAMILWILNKHSKTGSPNFIDDKDLAEATNLPIDEIRRQLDVLESQRLTVTANTMGVKSARISPDGILVVEEMAQILSQKEIQSIGFKLNDK